MATKRRNTKSSKSKSRIKKGKVYIAPYKIIILCTSIIAICMTLLLITTIATGERTSNETQIAKRYDPPAKNESVAKSQEKQNVKTADSKKETAKKSDSKQSKTEVQKTENKTKNQDKQDQKEQPKVSPQKKSESVNNKTESSANSSVKKTVETLEAPKNSSVAKADIPKQPAPAQPEKLQQPQPQTPPKAQPEPKSTVTQPASSGFNFPEAKNNAQIVIIFDDGGQNLQHLEKCITLPFPVSVAVLPRITYSKESAARVRKSGNELLLHQPMQAISSANPGPGAILPDMTEDQIISTLFQNINEIGPIAGFNNHEGSAITADAEKMAVVMKVAAESGVYFLDSRTNSKTAVPYVAREMGYSYYERNIFLDNKQTRENYMSELKKGLDIANKNGVVIMIGHVWSGNSLPAFLNEVYPELKQKGYTFTTVSKCRGLKN